jgi:hypothetical protein
MCIWKNQNHQFRVWKNIPAYTANPLKKGGKKKKKKTPGINHGQPDEKRAEEKKTLVLTLGSPLEKGGKKKKKKTLVLTLGSPPKKGGEKKLWY